MNHYRLRLSSDLWKLIHADLRRPHPHAHERMGVLVSKAGTSDSGTVLLPTQYMSFPDSDYVSSKADPSVLLGPAGITRAMSLAYNSKLTCLYVHVHGHRGTPGLSPPDRMHGKNMVVDLLNAWRKVPHGFVVLSVDAASGLISPDGKTFYEIVTPTFIYGRKTVIH